MPTNPIDDSPKPEFISQQVNESDYFFLNLKASVDDLFTVTCGGIEYCNRDYTVDRKRFDYYGIEYVVSGVCSLMLDGKSHQLKAGSIFCYGPSTPHQIRNTGDRELVKFFVDFTGSDIAEVIGDPFLQSPVPYQMPNLRGMHALFLQMHEIGKQGGRGCQRIMRQSLNLIATHARFRAVELEDASSRAFTTYERCLTHIEQHYTDLGAVSELADACNVSPGHLSRVFKKYSDESPWNMITRLKLNRAGELLLRGDMMIKEVAHDIGFEDPYHFSRVFKVHYGMSPKHFCDAMRSSASDA